MVKRLPRLRAVVGVKEGEGMGGTGRDVVGSSMRRCRDWDALPWRSVEAGDLGNFEDAVFCSLEEVDGSAFGSGAVKCAVEERVAGSNVDTVCQKVKVKRKRESSCADTVMLADVNVDVVNDDNDERKREKNKRRIKDEKGKERKVKETPTDAVIAISPGLAPSATFAEWNGIRFRSEVVASLKRLGFDEPTPVQLRCLPVIMRHRSDLVGCAETGSGKTLAFLLPVVDALLGDWDASAELSCPFALVLTPTRELAMQIAAVCRDLCAGLRASGNCIEIATVVGGMSIQKQRRQLGGRGRSAHVVVATPGRLCEMCTDHDTPSLRDLSRIRFLIVDEADRMVEEGHFPEVQRIFKRITDHEELVAAGKDPETVREEQLAGITEREDIDEEEEEPMEGEVVPPQPKPSQAPRRPSIRQTLLFSATMKAVDGAVRKKLKGIGGVAGRLPQHVQQLLASVARKGSIEVVDLGETQVAEERAAPDASTTSLPKTLKQLELRVAAEDKDAAVYQYLLENAGRTLLFCNSIKSVRRVDGLLRALNVNSRAIHAQMQQRQRLRSLDAFKAAPIGVLVATDVAARGLDVARIQHVVHYDIARSPQTYTHRSGRTARAGNSGTAISIVSPEDAASHELVLANLPRGAISMYRLDTTAVSERVRLAKQIFTASFVDMQTSKQEHWLQDMARDTGLELDDYMRSERGAEEERVRAAAVKKRGLEEKKRSLKSMLDRPAESKGQKNSSALGLPPRRKGSFIVVAK